MDCLLDNNGRYVITFEEQKKVICALSKRCLNRYEFQTMLRHWEQGKVLAYIHLHGQKIPISKSTVDLNGHFKVLAREFECDEEQSR